MSRFAESAEFPTPQAADSAPYTFERRVEMFEAVTSAALKIAINNWLLTLPAPPAVSSPTIFQYLDLTTVPGTLRVLVDYGYYVQPPP